MAESYSPMALMASRCVTQLDWVQGPTLTRVQTAILQEFLHQNGARLAVTPEQLCSHEDSELESGFLITPSNVARDALKDLPIVAEGLTRVNEWWVEKCLSRKKIVNPDEEVICKPFPRIPIPGKPSCYGEVSVADTLQALKI